jgi:hypothetical protein
MINREVSVLIALIHNNDVQRNAYIRPQLEGMAVALGHAFRPERMEVSFQPKTEAHSIGMAFMRDLMYRRLANGITTAC